MRRSLNKGAAMHENPDSTIETLHDNDIDNIVQLYGIRSRIESSTIIEEKVLGTQIRACTVKYDAAVFYKSANDSEGATYFFVQKRVQKSKGFGKSEIKSSIFDLLPQDVTNIDAAYSEPGTLWLFTKRQVHKFVGLVLESTKDIAYLGIGEQYTQINAVFQLQTKLHIFSGTKYWILENLNDQISMFITPKNIIGTFNSLIDYKSTFVFENDLFFIVREKFFLFDRRCMRIDRTNPIQAELFFECT